MKGRGRGVAWEVFLFRNVEMWRSNILAGLEQRSLEKKRLSLLLCGGGSSAGEERARIGE